MNLLAELEQAQVRVAQLLREIAQGPCRKYGHTWRTLGGSNAGCCKDCCCSVPVYTCSKCKDCDYGENAEADNIIAACALKNGEAKP